MPFDERSAKHPEYIVRSETPFNGGAPPGLLTRQRRTPRELFFVRNHAPVPDIDPASYRLHVDGIVENPLELSLRELESFERVEVEATLECAGNRRQELLEHGEIPGEVPWGLEAASNAVWSGVRLREVLERAGLGEEAAHLEFTGLDQCDKGEGAFGFGGSVPREKGLSDEVILADRMNGDELPPEHGWPLRVVVPGYIGARSVKWVSRITARRDPSHNFFQRKAYRRFGPADRPETADWPNAEMLGELPRSAVIGAPTDGEEIAAGEVEVRGYAVGRGGSVVEAVQVSLDGGRTWEVADLGGSEGPWHWRLWSCVVRVPEGEQELVCRLKDRAGGPDPSDLREVWNFKGYMNEAWHRVRVRAVLR